MSARISHGADDSVPARASRYRNGELRVSKATLGHRRTAFIGAALRELPDVEALKGPPGQRLRVRR